MEGDNRAKTLVLHVDDGSVDRHVRAHLFPRGGGKKEGMPKSEIYSEKRLCSQVARGGDQNKLKKMPRMEIIFF